MKLIKLTVCAECLSGGIIYKDCRCTYDRKYPTIELEFTKCECCNRIIDDGSPPETEFNKEQFKKLKDDNND